MYDEGFLFLHLGLFLVHKSCRIAKFLLERVNFPSIILHNISKPDTFLLRIWTGFEIQLQADMFLVLCCMAQINCLKAPFWILVEGSSSV